MPIVGFGAAQVTVKKTATFGAEILQQPQAIAIANRLSIIGSFVRLAGEVAPGVDLQATARYAIGAAFRF